MKKALHLTIVAVLATAFAQAQISKGSILLGGNIGFGKSKNETGMETKSNFITVKPTIGLTVKQNLIIGIAPLYSHTTNTSNVPDAENKATISGGGVFLRRYFSIAKKFYLFGESNLNFSHLDQKQITTSTDRAISKSNNIAIGVAPGVAYALSKKFHLELGFDNLINFNYAKYKVESVVNGVQTNSGGNSLALNTSLSAESPLTIGFRVFLSK